ncbi:phage integrase family protein [Hydrogenophaga sp. NFH-34]|uniref:phage integrase family protein n=1 Tax=Hydrogenophaga sp. NFH-34 TaxID=2744446 RepID=UPI001F39F222|nr:tyrosine-type recombinase/integrase [Hydrogenophaga sp. NFH-34]
MIAEVAEKLTRRGRPSGKARVEREAGLRLHDLSFARAVVQGLAPAAAAQRYLPESLVDERVASAHLRQVLQIAADILDGIEDQAAAKALSGYTGFPKSQVNSTACEKSSIARPLPSIPSLDEFAEEIGAEDFSEREILELYQERYGEQLAATPAPAAEAAAVDLDAVLRALSIVQSRGVVLPKPTDPVRLWFSLSLTTRLVDAQIVLLQDLVHFVNRHGRHWYKHVPGVGLDRARRLVGWLVQHEPFLELKIASRSRWDSHAEDTLDRMEKHTVWFSIPSPALGQSLVEQPGTAALAEGSLPAGGGDSLRSMGPNALGVQSDLDAVKAWLDTLSFKSPHTRTAYARDAQRLLFWAHERGKTLSTLTVTDAADHARFLVDPPAHWLCELPTRRADAAWRPMRGPLSGASAARALAAIGHLYGFLVETGFLVANPFSRIRRASGRGRAPQIDTNRSFRSYHLQMLVSVVHAMPPGPARRRARALLMLMASTGVRIGELGGTWGDVITTRTDWEECDATGDAQCLRVIGKGGKERLLPLKPSVVQVLQRHLDDRRALEQQGVLPALDLSKTPLISVVAKPVGPDLAKDNGGLSVAGIHRVIKALCERAAKGCADARLAAEFRAASAHWMRHTFAHAVLRASGGDLPVTQQLLGHASIATTGIYVKADMSQRLKAVMALPVMFDAGGLVRR